MKKYIKTTLVILSIVLIIFLPYLLIINFEKFAPIVLITWAFMAAFFVFFKKKERSGRDKKI
jgi:hypothetical protein